LQTITHHKAVDAVRASERRRRLHFAAVSESSCAPPERHIDEVVWWRLGAQSLSAAWPMLSPMQREVLGLAYVTGLTQSQIADRLGIPVGTVKSRTHAGMTRLREVVSGSWTPSGPTTPAGEGGPSQLRRRSSLGRPPEPRLLAPAAATDVLDGLADHCAAMLVRLVRDGPAGLRARTEMADRTAVLVDEHGQAGLHALILSLAHLAAGNQRIA
jgi:DNA-binding CsgD family transcriptional regulator